MIKTRALRDLPIDEALYMLAVEEARAGKKLDLVYVGFLLWFRLEMVKANAIIFRSIDVGESEKLGIQMLGPAGSFTVLPSSKRDDDRSVGVAVSTLPDGIFAETEP